MSQNLFKRSSKQLCHNYNHTTYGITNKQEL
ncbi:hypothetical protein TorRG33x02_283610 [Trema orientale]|uniref:Uncharacterized protein n=1 Tax=Trema orientale TaxID=63057 RepID=A0A2P5CIC8_TREOI|nr:hypothetical protein TorRG33x02_283610 [Trema orientale]